MPHVTQQISPNGPVLDCLVGVSLPRAQALQRAGQKSPAPVPVRGLIDTGASSTCVDPTCFTVLGLTPTGQIPIHTPSTSGTPHLADQYDVSLVLLHPRLQLTLHALPVIASTLKNQGIQALIGRDVLKGCLLVYDGAAGLFSLAF
jgi:hypothetical protein